MGTSLWDKSETSTAIGTGESEGDVGGVDNLGSGGVCGVAGEEDEGVEAIVLEPHNPKDRVRLRVLPKKSEVARKKKKPSSGTRTRYRMTETRMTRLDKGRSQQAKDFTSTRTGS